MVVRVELAGQNAKRVDALGERLRRREGSVGAAEQDVDAVVAVAGRNGDVGDPVTVEIALCQVPNGGRGR
jgi:hypothetical protein